MDGSFEGLVSIGCCFEILEFMENKEEFQYDFHRPLDPFCHHFKILIQENSSLEVVTNDPKTI